MPSLVSPLVSPLVPSWPRSGRVLALDSSLGPGSVALAEGGELRAQLHADGDGKGKLALLIDELLRGQSLAVSDVDAFVVAAGPGRFTGVRSAVAVAKGLAFATGKPIVAVGSLEALGAGTEPCVVLGDGPRSLYVDDRSDALNEGPRAHDLQEFVTSLRDGARSVPARIVGASLGPLREALHEAGVRVELVEHALDASVHLRVALSAGVVVAMHDVEPRYVREVSITPPKVAPVILPFAHR